MTAYRVIDQHDELSDVSGTLDHQRIDLYISEILTELSASGNFASGSSDPFAEYLLLQPTASLPNARVIVAGPGVILKDDPGNRALTASVDLSYVYSFMVWNEVVAPPPDGSNQSFSVLFPPVSGSLMFFENGVLQRFGHDYGLTGSNINLINHAPRSGANLLATYQK